MAERRALIEGLETITDADPELAADFVLQRPPRPTNKTSAPRTDPQPVDAEAPATVSAQRVVRTPAGANERINHAHLTGVGRVPVGARIRTELATALKRASLERQLHGIEPHSLQDILEEAIEPWLFRHGYLD